MSSTRGLVGPRPALVRLTIATAPETALSTLTIAPVLSLVAVDVVPRASVCVARTAMVAPMSALPSTYVAVVAPAIGSPPRSHW